MANMDRWMPILAPLMRGMIGKVQEARRSQIGLLPSAPDHVVFLGDSITEQGMWDEWFPDLPTVNRGVGGETVSQVMARLDNALIAPRAVSLLVGTNDLHGLGESRDPAGIADRMKALVAAIRARAPDAPLLVNGVLPRSTLFRDRILDLNERYRRIAAEQGATYVDTWPALADANGAIRPECTSDGIHLTGAGYRSWTDVLRPHLARFASPAA